MTAENAGLFISGFRPGRIRVRIRGFDTGTLDFILPFIFAFSDAVPAFSFAFSGNISLKLSENKINH
ncbi:MAG: hypothetical protein ABII68_06305 [Pseudomonadota bacterium]